MSDKTTEGDWFDRSFHSSPWQWSYLARVSIPWGSWAGCHVLATLRWDPLEDASEQKKILAKNVETKLL